MTLLLDTHLVLWALIWPDRLSDDARHLISDPENRLLFSVVTIWEVAIKTALRRPDFTTDPAALHRKLLDDAFEELAVNGAHAIATGGLPHIHRDPFDRLLLAQAMVEGVTLLTADPVLARYSGPVRLV